MSGRQKRPRRGLLHTLGVMEHGEYRAALDALNLFFGAIIGVQFARVEGLSLADYALLLVLTASLVALILIVSNTRRRLWAFVQLALFFAAYSWIVLSEMLAGDIGARLVVTLGCWALAALVYEYSPRLPDRKGAIEPMDRR